MKRSDNNRQEWMIGMKWTAKDLDMYVQAKEYVDTLLIPLVPLSFGERIKKSGSMNEFITILSMEIEKQMKGRIS